MEIIVAANAEDLGRRGAAIAAGALREVLARRESANLLVATGTSQFATLDALTREDVDWPRITGFHLDEYLGLPATHPASFCRYLKERLVDRVPLAAFHFINGEADADAECRRLGALIEQHPIDVALIGIGENGHLAFNDPPADFETEVPYLTVQLDEACRRQQLGEGWFATLDDVPRQAISMSVRQILKSTQIVCSVPDARKAPAVAHAVDGPVTPQCPASILQTHPYTTLLLDPPAAALLKPR